jgi:hypothetical protein
MSYTRKRRRTIVVWCSKGCPDCHGSTWRPLTIIRHGRIERAVERCPRSRIIRLGEPKQTPVDGKLLAAEASSE